MNFILVGNIIISNPCQPGILYTRELIFIFILSGTILRFLTRWGGRGGGWLKNVTRIREGGDEGGRGRGRGRGRPPKPHPKRQQLGPVDDGFFYVRARPAGRPAGTRVHWHRRIDVILDATLPYRSYVFIIPYRQLVTPVALSLLLFIRYTAYWVSFLGSIP